MMSMYDFIVQNTLERQVAFLHAARTRKHQAFNEVITKLNAELPSSNYAVLYSEEGDGFINLDFLTSNVIEGSDVYVCGPTAFMQAVIKDLHAMGIPEEKIHFEFFGPAMQLELPHA